MIERQHPASGEELANAQLPARGSSPTTSPSRRRSRSASSTRSPTSGPSRALRDAHDEAVSAARAYLEREACYVRRGHTGGASMPRPSPRRGLRLRGLPPPDEPRPGPPASHPRRHREPRPLRRPLVGARRLRALQARQGGRLPLRGTPPTRGARATAVGPLLGGREGDRRHRGRARGGAAGVQPSPRRDPGVARARGPKRAALGREGRACDSRAKGGRDRHGELARGGPRPGGRARARSRRARGADGRAPAPSAAIPTPRPRLATRRVQRD